jgi:hypothetical protein
MAHKDPEAARTYGIAWRNRNRERLREYNKRYRKEYALEIKLCEQLGIGVKEARAMVEGMPPEQRCIKPIREEKRNVSTELQDA